MSLRPYANTNFLIINSDTTLHEAASTMIKGKYDMAVIVNNIDGKVTPVGTLSEHDIVSSYVSEGSLNHHHQVDSVMDRNILYIEESTSLKRAVEVMKAGQQASLLVVDSNNEITGILNLKDLINDLSLNIFELTSYQKFITTNKRPRGRPRKQTTVGMDI